MIYFMTHGEGKYLTFWTFEWLGAEVVPQVILQVVLVLCDERTLRTLENLILFDVDPRVRPGLNLKL